MRGEFGCVGCLKSICFGVGSPVGRVVVRSGCFGTLNSVLLGFVSLNRVHTFRAVADFSSVGTARFGETVGTGESACWLLPKLFRSVWGELSDEIFAFLCVFRRS